MDQTSIGTLTPPVKAACDFNARLRIRRDVYSKERRGGNSVGRVPASQAGCRGFESRPPLQSHNSAEFGTIPNMGSTVTPHRDTITGEVFPGPQAAVSPAFAALVTS